MKQPINYEESYGMSGQIILLLVDHEKYSQKGLMKPVGITKYKTNPAR